ncbi:MAG: hypothetical protein MHM6MM_004001 [Cercozoa sp. M6MM]
MTENKRVVLAYSGGLDTSCILKWLIEEGFEVVCFLGDVGQPTGDVERLKAKALSIGAKACHVVDLQKEFVTDFIFPAFRANAIYESRYLLGTSIARPILTKALVEIAHQEDCKYLAHGATGKGNDQCRFELHAAYLDPSLSVIAPWRIPRFFERFPGRQHLLAYAAEQGIEVDQTPKKSYSMDENLLHISYESGVLEDPNHSADEIDFKMTVSPMEAPDTPETIVIEFAEGDPVKVTNLDTHEVVEEPLALFKYLNVVAGKHAVGRVDLVENRFVGIKSRGVYETPGGTILHMARMDLETLVLDRGMCDRLHCLSGDTVHTVWCLRRCAARA